MSFALLNRGNKKNTLYDITSILSYEDRHLMNEYINSNTMELAFGEGSPGLLKKDDKYEDPEWYFEGPKDSIFGITFLFGSPILRGKNIKTTVMTTGEVTSMFISYILKEIEKSLCLSDLRKNSG